jgi:P2-related tail formation protein
MISLYDYKTENALPSEMKTTERKALSYAFDQQKKMFIERIERVKIWADLNQVDDSKLDFLAVENRVLFYNSSLSPGTKRNLIMNSIYWYMKLGTRQAMEEMINIVFGNENTSIEEWYTYAGEAFHFRIAAGTTVTQISVKEFLQYLNTIKNARSRFDFMIFQNGITLHFKSKSEYQKFVYTFCGEFECGTYPNTEIGLQLEEIIVSLEGESEEGSVYYTPSGITPDISIGAAFTENVIDFQGASQQEPVIYPADSETESGTMPDIAAGVHYAEVQVGLEGNSEEGSVYYTPSGVTPDISVGAAFTENAIDFQGASQEETVIYPADSEAESGTMPDIAAGVHYAEVQVDLEGGSESETIVYSSDSDAESGSYPEPAAGLQLAESGVSTTPEGEDFNLYYDSNADKYAAEE